MKRCLLSLLCIAGWLLGGSHLTYGQSRPDWIFHPPQIPHYLVSTGIAKSYLDDSLTFVLARQNAILNLAKQYRIHVVSKMAESERGYSVKTAGYTSEIIDSTAFVLCGKNALVLDSILTEQGAYVLMTVREDLSESDGNPKAKYSRGLVTSSPQPAWIMTPPSKSGYLYGIGVSGRYRKEADSWDYAAKYARREVAMQLFTRKSTLRESVETDFANYNRKWSEDVADVILSTQKIVERWYDPEYDLFYCLISYKIPDSTDPK